MKNLLIPLVSACDFSVNLQAKGLGHIPVFSLEEAIIPSPGEKKEIYGSFNKIWPDEFATIGTRENVVSDTIIEILFGLGLYVNVAFSCVYKTVYYQEWGFWWSFDDP